MNVDVEELWSYCTMIVQTGNGSIPVRVNLDEDFYKICHMDFDSDGLLITIEEDEEM